MFPGISDFAGGQGNTFGGAAGPSAATGGNANFGGFSSGGAAGGFNPFVMPQSANPLNLVIVGAVVVGVAYFLKGRK